MSNKAPKEERQTVYVLSKSSEKKRQTVFILNEGEAFADVFTDDPIWKNHLKSAAKHRPEDCKLQKVSENEAMVEYTVPNNWVELHYYLDEEADRRHRVAHAAAREAYFAALDADPEGREEDFAALEFAGDEAPASEPQPQPGEG